MKAENKNFLMNVVYQGLTLVFPLITVPYISRVLGAERIGIYSYTYSIAYMFMLAGMLGINNYGNRSVALVRDDKTKLSHTFSSIYCLQIIINLGAVASYLIYIAAIGSPYRLIDLIQLIYVLSICFDVNWFFFGLEKFKLTIIRNLIIKVASLIFIFLLVRNQGDLWKYTLVMASSTLASQLYLFLQLPKYVNFAIEDPKEVFKHFRGVVTLFVPVLAFGVYRVIDKTMIGALSSVVELGYFENAEKLINIPVAVITALGTVMLPRMAYLISKDETAYKDKICESMNLALMLGTAMAVGLVAVSRPAANVIFGPAFEKSGTVICLLAVTVIASAWSNVMRTQYLIPKSLDRVYIVSTAGAAVLNFAVNIVLIPRFGSFGACIGTIVAELFIAIYQSVAVWSDLDVLAYLKLLTRHMLRSLIAGMLAMAAMSRFTGDFQQLMVGLMAFAAVFVVFNGRYIMHDFLGVKSN